jgi:hypothetical protein
MFPPLPVQSTSLLIAEEQFKPIPGYIDYGITPNGIVLDLVKRRFIKQSICAQGYYRLNLRSAQPGRRHDSRLVHCLVALAYLGPKAPGLHCDHISRNKLCNHATNLRYVSCSENLLNSDRSDAAAHKRATAKQRRKNKTGYPGVVMVGKTSWGSSIFVQGQSRWLGTFPTLWEAAQAYAMARKEKKAAKAKPAY